MAETVQASQQDGHFNESIVNEEILEDMKKNRIDHMKYLPDMEQLEESDVMDQVISAMNAYDYDKYTEADVRRALVHDNRTPGILKHCFHRQRCLFWKKSHRLHGSKQGNILETVSACLHRSTLQTTVRTTVFTVDLIATTRSAAHS